MYISERKGSDFIAAKKFVVGAQFVGNLKNTEGHESLVNLSYDGGHLITFKESSLNSSTCAPVSSPNCSRHWRMSTITQPFWHAVVLMVSQDVIGQRVQCYVKVLFLFQRLIERRKCDLMIVSLHRLLEAIFARKFLIERWLGYFGAPAHLIQRDLTPFCRTPL